MRGLTRAGAAASLLLGVAATAGLHAPLAAQEADPDPAPAAAPEARARDSVERPREGLERPPGTPPLDAIDVVTFPFRVAVLPLDLVGEGLGALFDLVTGPAPPSPVVRAYRDLREWGLEPDISSPGPRSGPALQAGLVRFRPFFLESAYSIRGSQLHRAGVAAAGKTVGGEASFQFRRQAEPRFWGLGPWSPRGRRSDFLWDQVAGGLVGRVRPSGWLELRGSGGWETNRVGPGRDSDSRDLGEVFDPATLFGADERTRFWRAGLAARLDLARRDAFQRRGGVFEAGATAYRGAGSTGADFHRLHALGMAYLPLNPRQLLFLRAGAEVNRPDAGRGVPFTHTADLGGSWGGRGYPDGRFRGRDLVALTAEWRYEVWRELQRRVRLEGIVFVDQGAVERRIGELESRDWAFSGGVGMRLVSRSGVEGLAHVAVGEEGVRFEVEVGGSP